MGGIRAFQSNISIYYSPSPQPAAPQLKLNRPAHENGQPLTTQSAWYNSLSGTTSFRLQACYGLLPARPGYMTCWVESLCMKRFCFMHPIDVTQGNPPRTEPGLDLNPGPSVRQAGVLTNLLLVSHKRRHLILRYEQLDFQICTSVRLR